jgi:imidazolonepropionase-like amidohydrolase
VVAGEKAAGYDYLKVYWNLEPAQFDAILAESRRQGIKAIGHVPFAVDIEAAIAAGLYSNEHLTGFYEYENILPRLDGIIAATARSGMWNCPTLIGLATILPPGDEAFAARQQRPEMRYVPGRIKERWVKDSVTWGTVMPPAGKFMDYFYMIAKSLSDGGCNLVAGSDCNMPWVVPGFSLHEELGQLQAAGLSPLAALKAATADAGRCLGRSDIGVIRPGAAADLVLLDADPRLSSAACARISGVMAGGTWYDRAALDGLLAGVAARAK